MKSMIRTADDRGHVYKTLAFWCPGCVKVSDDGVEYGGLHMLPIEPTASGLMWEFSGTEECPTLSPSILTHHDDARGKFVCHSFLRNGVFEFLGDCTHQYAGQSVPMPDLPTWVTHEGGE